VLSRIDGLQPFVTMHSSAMLSRGSDREGNRGQDGIKTGNAGSFTSNQAGRANGQQRNVILAFCRR